MYSDEIISEVKQAAAGRCVELYASLGISREILSGSTREHPCPKCGGKTRFRLIDMEDGALLCNKCFSTGNGDVIAGVMWWLECDFNTAVEKVADFYSVKLPAKRSASKKKSNDPAKDLEFIDWNELLAGVFCLKKEPLKKESFAAFGARMARYKKKHTVIALPIWRDKPSNITGWYILQVSGAPFPAYKEVDGEFVEAPRDQWPKGKSTAGSKSGIIGFINSDSAIAYKTEGPTDAIALHGLLDSSVSIITNSSGTKQNPSQFAWISDHLNGKQIRIIHDCDKPGQEGATFVKDRPGWAPFLASTCPDSVVKNIVLPYPIEETKGKDLRDWIQEGGTETKIDELADGADPIEGATVTEGSDVWEAENDPHRLSRMISQQYKDKHGGKLAYWRGSWWKYKRGCYRSISVKELRPKINEQIRLQFVEDWKSSPESAEKPVRMVSESVVSNTLGAMASRSYIADSTEMPTWLDGGNRNLMSMENGLLDIDAILAMKDVSECLLEHSENWFSPVKVGYKFDVESSCPTWEMVLRTSVGDPEVIRLLQQWAGYLLIPGNKYQKFICLAGDGKNGKSSIFAAMTAMIGKENVSTVPMHEFENRFRLATTIGKMANICDDVGEIDSTAEGVIKQFTGGGRMQAERKGVDAYEFTPSAKLMFSWNQTPRFRDRSFGLWRRMILVRFEKAIKDEDKILGLDTTEWWLQSGELPAILNWAIHGLNDLINCGGFAIPKSCHSSVESIRLDSNPSARFINENLTEGFQNSHIVCGDLYQDYTKWCDENGLKKLSSANFGKELKKKIKNVSRSRKRILGSLQWVYLGVQKSSEKEDAENFVNG